MERPKSGMRYLFVRGVGDDAEDAHFTCSDDGDALIEYQGYAKIFEHDPNGWRAALDELRAKGFELDEATSIE